MSSASVPGVSALAGPLRKGRLVIVGRSFQDLLLVREFHGTASFGTGSFGYARFGTARFRG
jgi:hypothetical protein